jgi:hypothetical protein
VVFGEVGMQREIVHTPKPSVKHVRYSGDCLGIQLTVTHDPQSACSFGDQDAAVRKEGKSVRVAEAAQRDDPEFRPRYLAAAGSTSTAVKNQGPIQEWGLDGNFLLWRRCGAGLNDPNRQSHESKEAYQKSISHKRPSHGNVRLNPSRWFS